MKKILVLCIVLFAATIAVAAPNPILSEQPFVATSGWRPDGDNLDQGSPDSTNGVLISGCPYNDAGNLDGDDDCIGYPYNEVFYRFIPATTGWYQFRVRNASGLGSNGAIRVYTDTLCTGTLVVANSNSVAGDCEGLTSQLTYARATLTAGTHYVINVGTATNVVSTGAYEFNMTCIQCPAGEWDGPTHNTCATAQPLACGDSLYADSASQETGLSPDWYSFSVASPSNVSIFVGTREWGHCTTGIYPGGSTVDGRFTIYNANCDSIGFGDDEGCSLDARATFALSAGSYRIKVWNKGTVSTSVRDYIIKLTCVGALDCGTYTACGTPAETEPNNDCMYIANFLEMSCGSGVANYYGTLCPASDVDYFHISPVATPGQILIVKIYDGAACDVFPATAARMRTAGLATCGAATGTPVTSYIFGTECVPYSGGYFAVVNNGSSELKYRVQLACSTAAPIACPDVQLPKQYCAGPCVGPINDNATVAYFLDVPLNEIIDDLNLRVNITHAFDADIDMYLITPWEDTLEITTDNGGSGDNYQVTLFDDEAATSVTAGAAPFNGSYQPEEPLSLADGYTAAGTYTLLIRDDFATGTGYVNCWCLEFTSHVPCAPDPLIVLNPSDPNFPAPQNVYACAHLVAGVNTQVIVPVHNSSNVPAVQISSGCSVEGQCYDPTCDPLTEWVMGEWTYYDNPPRFEAGLTAAAGATGCCVCLHLDFVLPVELNSFTAVSGDRSVTLNWTTASESNNDHYELMRDNVKIAEIAGSGSPTSGASYSWTDNNLVNGITYTYSLLAVDINGVRASLRTIEATPVAAVVITEYALYQNYPNPFNPTTSITFDLVEAGFVDLRVYNLMGQQVATLVQRGMTSGRHTVSFDAARLPSGIYVYKLNANSFTATHKMVLMK